MIENGHLFITEKIAKYIHQVLVQANYKMTHHKLQQKLFLHQQSQKVS